MERTQLGGYAAIMEAAEKTDRPGVVKIEMADWAAVELGKFLRALETVSAIFGKLR